MTPHGNTTHGHTVGGVVPREYLSWQQMLNRCRNPRTKHYKDYGGRGIVVCARWSLFENFFADMGSAPAGMTLDRENNDGNYEPNNCRWATPVEQARNTRRNVFIDVDGVSMCLTEAAAAKGLKKTTLWQRLYAYNWTVEQALNTPVR